jgi:hypothetical protein
VLGVAQSILYRGLQGFATLKVRDLERENDASSTERLIELKGVECSSKSGLAAWRRIWLVAVAKGHHEVGAAASDSGSGYLDNAVV